VRTVSLYALERAIGGRIELGDGERIVAVYPSTPGKFVVWIEEEREPVQAQTTSEAAVTEEVAPGTALMEGGAGPTEHP
jgi:hypothetical protein